MPSRLWRHLHEFHKRIDQSIPTHRGHRSVNALTVVACLTVGGLLLLVLVLIVLLWLYGRKKLRFWHPPKGELGPKLSRFSYRQLERATDKFSNARRLGKGGFGIVYQGVLKNGQHVAIKRLVLSCQQGEREFQNELYICRRLNSRYIVKLLGFSSHGEKVRLLVYEYLQNRSLQEALLAKKVPIERLDWPTRYNFILSIAKALAYLHLECNPPVIHGDIKPSNVLLDEKFNAVLADFGLARVKIVKDTVEGKRPGTSIGQERLGSDPSDHPIHLSEMLDSLGGDKPKSLDVAVAKNGYRRDMVKNGWCRSFKHVRKPNTMADHLSSTVEGSVELESSLASLYVESPHMTLQSPTPNSVHTELEGGANPFGSVLHDDDLSQQQQKENGRKVVTEKRASGKDWWWNQKNNSELKVQHYVMEWMTNQLVMSTEVIEDNDEQQQEQQKDVEKKRRRKTKREAQKKKVMVDEQQPKARKDRARNRRKGREWWKDEYFAELSEKSRKESEHWYVTAPVRGARLPFMPPLARYMAGMSDKGWLQEFPEGTSEDLSHEVSSTTSLRGTLSYVAPELGISGTNSISEAGDIYSFGVLLLVIISGRRPIDISTAGAYSSSTSAFASARRFEHGNLITWARMLAQSGNIFKLVDEYLTDYVAEQVQLCINMAILCIQRVPSHRPTITAILKALERECPLSSLPLELSPSPPQSISYYHSPLRTCSLVSSDDLV